VNKARPADEIDRSVRAVMESEGVSYGEAMEMLNVVSFERSARHGGIERRFGPEEARLAKVRKELDQRFVPSNAGAYDEVERRIRALQREGLPLVEASRKALEEPTHTEPQDEPDRNGVLGTSVISLMGVDRPVPRGRSRKGRRRGDAPHKARGRPYVEDEPRTSKVSARVSDSTQRALEQIREQSGLNCAAILAAVAIVHEQGRFDVLRAVLALAPRLPSQRSA
jgi:hypothetical protein